MRKFRHFYDIRVYSWSTSINFYYFFFFAPFRMHKHVSVHHTFLKDEIYSPELKSSNEDELYVFITIFLSYVYMPTRFFLHLTNTIPRRKKWNQIKSRTIIKIYVHCDPFTILKTLLKMKKKKTLKSFLRLILARKKKKKWITIWNSFVQNTDVLFIIIVHVEKS